MGFFDDPTIDISSQISEESVLATKQAFLQKNGFLVREENPDKGVDFDVELIIDNQVSGFKFAIQIKSAQNLQTIQRNKNSFVSYPIKTSRLGYLCRRSPGFGLIVVYDEKNRQLYYDFVEDIFSRIVTEHNNDNWMQNDTVKFHIGSKNIVDSVSIKNIFEKMKQRRSNFNDMYARKANDFDLPTFEYNEFEDPAVILEKYGYILFSNKEYQIIHTILSGMNLNKILDSPKILLLSAITYYQIGQWVEGDFFLNKCDAYLNKYDDEERELLHISKLTSDFSLGKMTRLIYYEKLKELEATVKGALNSIYLSLQILFVELLNKSIYEETSFERVLKDVKAIEAKVSNLDVPEETRYSYMLEVASFIHEIGMRQFLEFTARMMIQKRSLGLSPIQERLANANLLVDMLIVKPRELLQLIWAYSNRTNNAYLQAMVLFKKTYMFYGFTVQSFMSAYCDETNIENFKATHPSTLFELAYRDIINAYNIFKKRRDLSHAYKCLSISVEINYLFSFIHSKNIDDDLYKRTKLSLESLEKELHVEPYRILTEEMLIDLVSKKERHEDMADGYTSLSTEQKYQLANIFVKSNGLPTERIENVITEINFMGKARQAVVASYINPFFINSPILK